MEQTLPDSAAQAARELAGGRLNTALASFRKLKTVGAAYTATLDDAGSLLQCATDNGIVTLPKADTCKGMELTLQNTGADLAALIRLDPNAADKIKGTVIGGATGVPVQSAGVANKDWNNTKASAESGDYTTIVSDGVDTWWIVGGVGVWASEA